MGKLDRRSRDQKRKAKLKKKAGRSRKHESMAYHGTKYRSEEYVGFLHRTEVGIYESYVLTDHTLIDDEVEESLEGLILRLRRGALPPPGKEAGPTGGDAEDLVVWNIRRNWEDFASKHPLPRRDDVIGVLRTILASLETWRSKNMHPQGYLRFLEGFLKETGVSVVRVRPGDALPFDPGEGEDDDDPILDLGRDWIEDGDEDAAEEFREELEGVFEVGDAERAVAICRQLLGEAEEPSVVADLQALLRRGQRAIEGRVGPT